MKSCFFKKIGAAFIAVVMIAVSAYMPAFAATDKIQVIFTDVTATDPTTLSGEAKIMVSVKGVSGEATIAQMALEFSGNLKYKSINFLKGENNPDEGSVIFCQSAAVANNNLKITPSIICPLRPITFSGEQEDLFVLTFAGNAGDKVKLTLDDIENTYCEIDGNMYYPSKRITTNNTYTGSKDANNGKEAGVKLVMDVVTDFKAIGSDGANKSAVVNLKITSENAESKGYTIVTELSNTAISKGGHRDGSASIPTFVINNIVLDNSTYTVELSGIGYVPYKATGVTFDEVLEITNADFIPGDVDADEDVDGADKAAWYEIYESGEYNEAADFNRDGKINMYDITSDGKSVETVYAGIELPDDDEEVEENQPTVPAKMNKPTLSGGNGKISVKWKQPSDGGSAVTGYIIKYGTSTSNLNRTKEITKADATSATIDDLSDGAKYYVAIAAKNAVGTGEFSDTASATTDSGSDDSGGGGGGGGGGGSVGGGVVGGTTVVPGATVTPGNNANLFTDLGEHQWAQEAVYALRDAGIIQRDYTDC